MTAIARYERLEAMGTWKRAGQEPKEVILSLGEAMLTMFDSQENPLSHWSLAAVTKGDVSEEAVTYYPEGCSDETLEIAKDETFFIEAMETIQSAVHTRRTPKKKTRLRYVAGSSLIAAAAVFLFVVAPIMAKSHLSSSLPTPYKQELISYLQKDRTIHNRQLSPEEVDDTLRKLLDRESLLKVMMIILNGNITPHVE